MIFIGNSALYRYIAAIGQVADRGIRLESGCHFNDVAPPIASAWRELFMENRKRACLPHNAPGTPPATLSRACDQSGMHDTCMTLAALKSFVWSQFFPVGNVPHGTNPFHA